MTTHLRDSIKVFFTNRSFVAGAGAFLAFCTITDFVVNTGLSVLTPHLFRLVIDRAIPNRDLRLLGIVALVEVSLIVGLEGIGLLMGYLKTRVGMRLRYRNELRVFGQCLRIDLNRNPRFSLGYLMQLNGPDVQAALGTYTGTIPTALQALIEAAVFGGLVVYLSPPIALLAGVLFPLQAVSAALQARFVRPEEKKNQEEQIARRGRALSFFKSLDLLHTFGSYLGAVRSHKEGIKRLVKQSWRTWTVGTKVSLIASVLRNMNYLVSLYALYLVIRGDLTLGVFFALNAYLGNLFGAVGRLGGVATNIAMASIPINRLVDARMVARTCRVPQGIRQDVSRGDGSIELRRLTFGYTRGRPVLEDISLRIEQGAHSVLMGPTGSGKSTIGRLVAGLETRGYTGEILLDGISYGVAGLHSVRRKVLLCGQQVSFLPLTIMENLTMMRTQSRSEVIGVCKLLGIDEWVSLLPEGYNTHQFLDHGSSLSGGQQQLLSLARAVLADPEVLILDEPTASLDEVTAQEVIRAIQEMRKGRTTLVITHSPRVSSLFDRLCIINQGRVVGAGTHKQLLGTCDVYRAIHMLEGRSDPQLERQALNISIPMGR